MKEHTSKEMILKASSEHELINKQPVIILATVSNQLGQIGISELPKEVNFRLKRGDMQWKTTMLKALRYLRDH